MRFLVGLFVGLFLYCRRLVIDQQRLINVLNHLQLGRRFIKNPRYFLMQPAVL